jgi:hypothetical protein
MRLVKRAHVNANDIRPETVAAVASADDAQPNAAPERPPNARLDVHDFYRPRNRGRTAEAGLPVLDRPTPIPIQQRDLGRELLQRRRRVLGERRHDGGRVEQEMDLVVGGFLAAAAAAQGAADVAPLGSGCLVRCGETRDESGEAVEYLAVIVFHADDAGRERRRLLAHQAVQVQTFAVEDHHQGSPLWLVTKHIQRSSDEAVVRLHAVHAVAEEDDIKLSDFAAARARSGVFRVRNERNPMDIR